MDMDMGTEVGDRVYENRHGDIMTSSCRLSTQPMEKEDMIELANLIKR
jgi:hypothetical protein